MRKLTLILVLSLFAVGCAHSQQEVVTSGPQAVATQETSKDKSLHGKKIAEDSGVFAALRGSKVKKRIWRTQ